MDRVKAGFAIPIDPPPEHLTISATCSGRRLQFIGVDLLVREFLGVQLQPVLRLFQLSYD